MDIDIELVLLVCMNSYSTLYRSGFSTLPLRGEYNIIFYYLQYPLSTCNYCDVGSVEQLSEKKISVYQKQYYSIADPDSGFQIFMIQQQKIIFNLEVFFKLMQQQWRLLK